MNLAMVISQTSPELVFNAFRLANFSRKEGDEVKVFLLAEGVELDGINNPKFDVRGQAESFPRRVGRSSHAGRASSCATRKDRSCAPCPR